MAYVLADRVLETSTTTGTGTFDLDGVVAGFRTFVAGVGSTNTCSYCIELVDGSGTPTGEFEIGIGTVTDASPDTLSRDTIIRSSNADAAVNFSAGTKNVFVTREGEKLFLILHLQANQTISNNTSTDIAWGTGTTQFDVGDWHSESTTNERIFPPARAIGRPILVRLQLSWAGGGTGGETRNIRINHFNSSNTLLSRNRHNAALIAGGQPVHMQASGIFIMAAGDYLKIAVFHNEGGNLDIDADDAGLVHSMVEVVLL